MRHGTNPGLESYGKPKRAVEFFVGKTWGRRSPRQSYSPVFTLVGRRKLYCPEEERTRRLESDKLTPSFDDRRYVTEDLESLRKDG